MIVELFILYQIIGIGFFIAAYFVKQEVFWAISVVLAGFNMVSAYNISEVSYPQLMGVNLIFFLLAIVYGFYDIFDKYGWKFIPFIDKLNLKRMKRGN